MIICVYILYCVYLIICIYIYVCIYIHMYVCISTHSRVSLLAPDWFFRGDLEWIQTEFEPFGGKDLLSVEAEWEFAQGCKLRKGRAVEK